MNVFANRTGKWICGIGRVLLGAMFIYAAILKIDSPQDFADRIAAYQILPAAVINIVALGLPLFELVCGLLVLSGFYMGLGALGIFGMLSAFVGALGIALLRGLSIDCGCFGGHSWLDMNPWMALGRDVILLALAGVVYCFGERREIAVA
jgi:hypothetical protein